MRDDDLVPDRDAGSVTARTIVMFHAHPDDETVITGGTIARAHDDGDRVVLVFATRGEVGEVADGVLAPGETLADHRVRETERAAAILGAARVEFLGYRDSGMAGTDTMTAPGAFAACDVDEAAQRLVRVLQEEATDVLVVYDEHGSYGHPDHIQVHHVGRRAAELAGTRRVYAATVDRERLVERLAGAADALPVGVELPDVETLDLGVPSERITTTVDVTRFVDRKRAAMRAHASQIPPDSYFLALPDDLFVRAFGTEWFIRLDSRPGAPEDWILQP